MLFDELLNLIETQLSGKQLVPVSSQSESITLERIEKEQGKYFIREQNNNQNRQRARSISELQAIWNVLKKDGFCSVDQALYGSGSSRNQPETIFANLPFIQHFKYKNKKHLLLCPKSSRDVGTIEAVTEPELSVIKQKIDNFLSLSISELRSDVVLLLNETGNKINKADNQPAINIKPLYKKLEALEQKLAASQITKGLQEPLVQEIAPNPLRSTEQFPDSEEFTGQHDSPLERELSRDTAEQVRNTKMYPQMLVLTLIFDRVEYDEIELQPDFQRKDRIWSQKKKSKLIESILMGLPLPLFYFGVDPNPSDNTWIVVDGLQRITTIYDFMKGDITLEGLEVLHELNGSNFDQLSRIQKRKIKEYQISAYMIEHRTAENNNSDVLIELFQRINTYGTKLSPQEIRSALNQGSSVPFLRYLASTEAFLQSTQYRINPARQGDMELCLNALAFMLLGYRHFTNQSWDGFLIEAMRLLNHWDSVIDTLDSEALDTGKAQITSENSHYYTLAKQFEKGVKLASEIFEESAFRKDISSNKKTISSTLFQIIVSYFSQLSQRQTSLLKENKEIFVAMLYEAIDQDSAEYADWKSETYSADNRGFHYALSTSTGKRVTVHYRFEAFAHILHKSTGIKLKQTAFLTREDINDNHNH